MQPAIDFVCTSYAERYLGKEGKAMLADINADNQLPREYKRLVCLTAFRSVFRQIDLVLTPTGFGIVSSGGVAPASKSRVDALYRQPLDEEAKASAIVVHLLRSLPWGATVQASYALPYLYTKYRFFFVDSFNTKGVVIVWRATGSRASTSTACTGSKRSKQASMERLIRDW